MYTNGNISLSFVGFVISVIAFGCIAGALPIWSGTAAAGAEDQPNSWGFPIWAEAKCDLHSSPMSGNVDHKLYGIFTGMWDNIGQPASFVIYKVKDGGEDMGDVRLYYANKPGTFGSVNTNGGCWKKHKAKIRADGVVELQKTGSGPLITLTWAGDNSLVATYNKGNVSATGTFSRQ